MQFTVLKSGFLFLALLLGSALSSPALAGSYQYMEAAEVKARLETQAPLTLLDIQVEEDFSRHHIPGALATFAYPVKSSADQTKIAAFLQPLSANDAPIVIVCPRGGGGAKRAFDYLAANGIASGRLYILEKGQAGWPYPELTTGK